VPTRRFASPTQPSSPSCLRSPSHRHPARLSSTSPTQRIHLTSSCSAAYAHFAPLAHHWNPSNSCPFYGFHTVAQKQGVGTHSQHPNPHPLLELSKPAPLPTICFRINTCRSVSKQRTLSPLESTPMKNPGEGVPSLAERVRKTVLLLLDFSRGEFPAFVHCRRCSSGEATIPARLNSSV
jgi:hypothetical protein